MALGHGKDTAVYLNGRNAGTYLKSADATHTADTHETTTMGSSYVTRVGGLFDSKMSCDGIYDGTATTGIYALAKAALSSSSVSILNVYPLGEVSRGDVGLALRARITDHSVEMPCQNILTVSSNFTGYGKLELIESLHPLAAETTTGNGTALDGAAATTNNGAVWVHCTAFTGTSITLTVEDSADNSSFATIATFTAITAGGSSERIAITGTIRRYVRVVRSGTYTTATFSVGLYRG